MANTEIKKVCAVGTGAMGAGIALAFAMAEYKVHLFGRADRSLADGAKNIEQALSDLTAHGLVSFAEVPNIMARIEMTTDLAVAANSADLVVELIRENLGEKQEIFAMLDQYCPPHTILGTNTSSLSPTAIAAAVSDERKHLLLGIHLFNPPHLMSLVEVVAGQKTSEHTMTTTLATMRVIGKAPVRLDREISGYIVNRVQAAMWWSAFTLLDRGFCAAEIDAVTQSTLGQSLKTNGILESNDFSGDGAVIGNTIQTAMRNAARALCERQIATPQAVNQAVSLTLGLRLPVTGPVVSSELTGLDVVKAILDGLRNDLFNGEDIPRSLETVVSQGFFGAKSGRGVVARSNEEWSAIRSSRVEALVSALKKGSNAASIAACP